MSDFQKFLDENLANVQINDDEAVTDNSKDYDIYREIREMVIELRHDNQMTQKELAVKCGITQANISNLENGTTRPTIESLKKIADALGMRLVVEFVGWEVE
ncbi:MAG: helix-turn-helix domain-containing protein [Eubacterium sp.]|uniref:Putative transcriptional regulator with C-terminal CBS domains n=1 Tax=Eubacterium cellulosolvens (strain ATCC 43171 / JCM 9499 / 6) TaxID=633697 RepID=I5AVJ9_EUBC6|nr:helix-turn-helix transcriptional regulator [[Eubacterium] cellulosolvens]MCR4653736.1 helix-turn-helix domain-containing protein [Eubacterium sp.]